MNQLNSTYKGELSSEDLLDAMKQLMEKASPKKTAFVVMTGTRGMEMFNLELRRSHLRGLVTELRRADKITREEETTLDQMIDSPDNENLTVAEVIIEQKQI